MSTLQRMCLAVKKLLMVITDTDWSKGTGWTIAGGAATYDGLNSTQSLVADTGAATIGETYLVSFDVVGNEGSGNNSTFFGGVLFSGGHLPVGSYNFRVTAVNAGRFTTFGRAGEVYSIDNISVKQVTNVLSYRNIADTWTGSNELVVNGDFATDTDWLDLAGASSSISASQITVTTTVAPSGAYQAFNTTTSYDYRVTGKSVNQASDLILRVSNGATATIGIAEATMVNNLASFNMTAISGVSTVYLRNTSIGTNVWDNVSVKRKIEAAQ